MTLLTIIGIIDQVVPIATFVFNYFKNKEKQKHLDAVSGVTPSPTPTSQPNISK